MLFCDLVDSTTLAGQLDPEDLREVIQAYQAACAGVIERFEGHIAQYLGDGLLVYFGYPQAHEDDARRAVRAGLGMVDALGILNTRLEQEYGVRLAVRVGMHTGLVVVGEMGAGGRQEQLALGETPNIAARLQGLAAPDTVVMGEATYRLVQDAFTTEDYGSHALKGIAGRQQVYRVVQAKGTQRRVEIPDAWRRVPLVGRDTEVMLLRERWAQAKAGQGQVVLLSGEAGIGKSRLVQALKDHIAEEVHTCQECRCSPYHTNSTFFPLLELLRHTLHWHPHDSAEEKLHKLEKTLAQKHLDIKTALPLFTTLLALPLPEDQYTPLPSPSPHQRHQTMDAFLQIMWALTVEHPVLFILEDLHWIDPSTLELLDRLIEQGSTRRLLLVLTCRPTFHPPWPLREHLTFLPLRRVSRHHAEQMVARITGNKPLPAEVLEQIVVKTDGVPLFVEELTKMVLESGWLRETAVGYTLARPLPTLPIPATLHDSLMARLDRLGTAKGMAQLGATIGRQFSYELLQALAPRDESTLQQELGRLVAAELLYQRGVPPHATYLFKHALIQETAYQSLLKSTRQQYHQQIAQVFVARFPETVETQPELVAHHYTEAGLSRQAVEYWQRAGQHAIERSAHLEAIEHLTKGLAVLKALPDTPEHTQQECNLQISLGSALMAAKGWSAPAVEQAYMRARELCQQMGDSPQYFSVLRGLWTFYNVRGKLQAAYELAEQCLTLAQRMPDPVFLLWAHQMLGATLFFRGALPLARTHLEQGIALYDPQQSSSQALRALHATVVSYGNLAEILWCLGYPDQALQRLQQGIALAQEPSRLFSLAYALDLAARLHQFRQEKQITQEKAEAVITIAREQGFPLLLARGTIVRGWSLAAQGQVEEGITQMQEGMEAYRSIEAKVGEVYHRALLAEGYAKRGHPAEGVRILDEILTPGSRLEEHRWESELYRLKGDCLLHLGPEKSAEAASCFQQALDITRRQQAKSLELRAAMSLCRLWQQQGKRRDAYDLLAPIYHWFTEGFETKTLQEAKVLLKALACE
ncbi:MAG: hypothetical protein D6736_14115 [Nitrospinota bacterium]|nr:MAG: hypothetical protein D6736_14115 [Nitrospinota bacterium]